jgi:hypothetical protein
MEEGGDVSVKMKSDPKSWYRGMGGVVWCGVVCFGFASIRFDC